MGKSALMMNIAVNTALEHQIPVLVFSLEMSKQALIERAMCSESRVDSTRVRNGFLEQRDWVNLVKAASRISDAPLWIDDSGVPTMTEIRAKCRRWRSDKSIFPLPGALGLVAIDYLQLIRSEEKKGDNRNREQQVAEISKAVKALAKELGIPIALLSQLNRGVESRADKRPTLADLRESGAIEQDADLIAFIYRDEVYNKESPDRGVAEVIIGKQREGPCGTVRLAFLDSYARFENLSDRQEHA